MLSVTEYCPWSKGSSLKASSFQLPLLGNVQGGQPGGMDERNQPRAEIPSVEDLLQFHQDDLGNKKYMAMLQQGGLEVMFVFEKGLPKVSGALMDVGLAGTRGI